MQNFIDKTTRSSRATDREGLCIIQGKLAWSVTVQIHLLNDDGNAFDAVFLAAILAMKNTRLPEVSMSKNMIRINDQKLKYLNVHHMPICTTFYFLKDMPDNAILDVTAKEEILSVSRLSIVMNTYEDICGITTLGATEIDNQPDQRQLMDYMRLALKKTKLITNLIRTKWESRFDEFSLLDQVAPSAAFQESAEDRTSKTQSFIKNLNE